MEDKPFLAQTGWPHAIVVTTMLGEAMYRALASLCPRSF